MKEVKRTGKIIKTCTKFITLSILMTATSVLAQSRNGNQGGQDFGGGQGGGQNGGVSDPGVRSDAVVVGTPLSTSKPVRATILRGWPVALHPDRFRHRSNRRRTGIGSRPRIQFQ